MVERCFNRLKNARRLATRYDKTAASDLGFIHLISIRLWMREFVNTAQLWFLMRLFRARFGDWPLRAECGRAVLNQSSHPGRSAVPAFELG